MHCTSPTAITFYAGNRETEYNNPGFRRASVSVEDYDNPDSADVVPENAIPGSESEGKVDASSGDGLTFSQLDDEARDAVL
ncbi:hypothetical protein Tco_0190139 [Tanacetum coccineum]